ncbi:MAG: DUF460 domain-containing protein [Candidatus Bathyarchaeia archaeon]
MSGAYGIRRLIVGVDPGLNCGLAVLMLDGTPVLVESHRGWSLAKIIERLRDLGEPTIVSSDVSPAPSLLERLSKRLNAVLFEPAISMSAEEKHRLARLYIERYNVKVENIHEVDALAAAIKAYQHYKNKFEQVDAKLKESQTHLFPDEVKSLVARGYSISRAIRILKEEAAERTSVTIKRIFTREDRMREVVKELTGRLMLERERNRLLKAANRELQLKIKNLELEIENLKKALDKVRNEQNTQIRREREYQRLMEEIRTLKNKISEQESQIEIYRQKIEQFQYLSDVESKKGLTLLKPVEAFTKEGLEKAFRLYNIRAGDFIFILDPSGGGSTTAESLAKRSIKAIIIRGIMAHQALEVFEKYYVPVIQADELKIKWINGLPYADPEEIKKLIKQGKTLKSSDDLKMLKTIIDDHLKDLKERGHLE